MILKGNRRGGGMQMALHLLNAEDNEHVTIHEMRGFISDSLTEALTEAYAISRGTRCKKFLYSLSLSPPETESVPVEVFEEAINDIEKQLGFTNQPRAIVFHEKEGRRHAHCVWSRIDVQEMKAIDPSFDKLQLRDMSRELYLEHGWKMPRGLMNSKERDPLNFTMAEMQQAKRHNLDPRTIKQTILECWAVSDSRAAFASVLKERGYYLAKGDKRGHVVVDWHGEVYSVSRIVGIRAKEVCARLGNIDTLPSIDDTKAKLVENFTGMLKEYSSEIAKQHAIETAVMNERKQALTFLHRHVREQQKQDHEKCRIAETKQRSLRLPTGIKALWFRLTGQYKAIRRQNEAEAHAAQIRDRDELQTLINRQQIDRQQLQHEVRSIRFRHVLGIKKLNRDMATFVKLSSVQKDVAIQQIEQRKQQKHYRHRYRGPTLD